MYSDLMKTAGQELNSVFKTCLTSDANGFLHLGHHRTRWVFFKKKIWAKTSDQWERRHGIQKMAQRGERRAPTAWNRFHMSGSLS